MKKWQPPIPAGAFCSPEAIRVNTALPLLGWCYDQVGTNGWLELNLHTVAGGMDVPYHTVKKWWAALRASEFIAEVDERGRGGMRVRMADDWLDWRVLALRETVPNPVPKTENGTETVPEKTPKVDNRDRNGTGMRPNPVPINSAYKEDHQHQESSPSTDDDDDFLKTLIREYSIGVKRAREIVATGVDPETCYQSIRNRVNPKDAHTLGRVILDLVAAPPEKGHPYDGPYGKPQAQKSTGPPPPKPDTVPSRKLAELAKDVTL